MNSKTQIIISIISAIFVLFLLKMNTDRDTDLSQYLSKGNMRDLYSDSISNKIVFVDYPRCERIILDDNREYFFTISDISGAPRYHGALNKCVKPGDSVFKKKNSTHLIIQRQGENDIRISFFK